MKQTERHWPWRMESKD